MWLVRTLTIWMVLASGETFVNRRVERMARRGVLTTRIWVERRCLHCRYSLLLGPTQRVATTRAWLGDAAHSLIVSKPRPLSNSSSSCDGDTIVDIELPPGPLDRPIILQQWLLDSWQPLQIRTGGSQRPSQVLRFHGESVHFYSLYRTVSDTLMVKLEGELLRVISEKKPSKLAHDSLEFGPFSVNAKMWEPLEIHSISHAHLLSALLLVRSCALSLLGDEWKCVDSWDLSNDSLSQPFSRACFNLPKSDGPADPFCVGRIGVMRVTLPNDSHSHLVSDSFGPLPRYQIREHPGLTEVVFELRHLFLGGTRGHVSIAYSLPVVQDGVPLVIAIESVSVIKSFELRLSTSIGRRVFLDPSTAYADGHVEYPSPSTTLFRSTNLTPAAVGVVHVHVEWFLYDPYLIGTLLALFFVSFMTYFGKFNLAWALR